MKLFCRGAYHNAPAGLHFSAPGIIEVDNSVAEFLLRDAPENFTREIPVATKSVDKPAKDKMFRRSPRVKEQEDGEEEAE